MRDLGTLGGDNSSANAVNNRGGGRRQRHSQRQQPSLPSGVLGTRMQSLGTLGGQNSVALQALNDATQVVGSSQTADGNDHAPSSGPRRAAVEDLGTLGGLTSEAIGITQTGVSRRHQRDHRGYRRSLPVDQGQRACGVWAPWAGTRIAVATGVNAHRQVVGASIDADGDDLPFSGPRTGASVACRRSVATTGKPRRERLRSDCGHDPHRAGRDPRHALDPGRAPADRRTYAVIFVGALDRTLFR